ncbi:hypothetical protein [Lutibaculum baratangense]|uniref:Uncharacterized protein n=1 Tax=Lutibaculum baratangense AMV1 TaxID=631454 RepID=V4RJM9_9HYPH|nr:hypothetical protein [Lutibaculum baratangense]ESR25529.1 hypothetical protein N177_1641 [Lutibaculum baratangense AMV1]
MHRILMTTAAAVIAVPAMTVAGVAQQADTMGGQEMPSATGTPGATGTTETPGATGTPGSTYGTPDAGAATGAQTAPGTAAQTGEAAPGQAGAGMTVDTVVSSISDSSESVEAISNSSMQRIGVVMIDERAGPEAVDRVNQAVEDNPQQVTNLQDAIRGNPVLLQQIEGSGLQVESIVAAQVTPDNDLILFTRS